MAKKKRVVVGSVVKSRESGKPDYIKIKDDITLKKGQTLSLESAANQLKSLEQAVKDGKLSEEVAENVKDRISKIPEFVRFEIVTLVDNEQ